MNKELMMKAAVEFKGVWPDEEETHLYKFRHGSLVSGMFGGTAELVCTREQFKSFVESLFEGAPDEATHFQPNSSTKWYKISKNDDDTVVRFWVGKREWGVSMSHKKDKKGDISTDDLIPRPTKKAEIEAPYMPQVGEECEFSYNSKPFRSAKYIGPNHVGSKTYLVLWVPANDVEEFGEYDNFKQDDNINFRPLKTERDKIRDLALECGFKLKEQPNGKMDLNQYVYDFANALKGANSI
jgi:hypothetical protein